MSEESGKTDWPIAIFLIIVTLCVTAVCLATIFTGFWFK